MTDTIGALYFLALALACIVVCCVRFVVREVRGERQAQRADAYWKKRIENMLPAEFNAGMDRLRAAMAEPIYDELVNETFPALRVISLPDGTTWEDAQAIARTIAEIDDLPEVER